jgi:hypothetical protein
VRRRSDLGVASTEINEWRPRRRGRSSDATEERDEVLLRQPVQTLRSRAHFLTLTRVWS